MRKKDLILIPGSGFSPKRVWLGTNKIGRPQMYQRGKKTTAEKGTVGRATGGYFFSFCSGGGAKLAPRAEAVPPPLFSPQSSLSWPLKRGRKGGGPLGKIPRGCPLPFPPLMAVVAAVDVCVLWGGGKRTDRWPRTRYNNNATGSDFFDMKYVLGSSLAPCGGGRQ